jgi:hypothetical protein
MAGICGVREEIRGNVIMLEEKYLYIYIAPIIHWFGRIGEEGLEVSRIINKPKNFLPIYHYTKNPA